MKYDRPSPMRRLLLRLAYANVVISLHAAGLACAALVLAGERLSLSAIALPAAAMYAVYTFDKVARFDPQDAVNDPERSAFIRRLRRPLLIAGAITAIGGGGAALAHGPAAALLFALPLVAGVLYALPLLPRGAPARRIKDVTGLKSIYVAAVWTATTGALPLVVAGAPIEATPALMLVGAWLFSRMFVNTVYFDLGDLEGDRASGTRTIPVVLGFAGARRLLQGINLVAGVLLVGGAAIGWLPAAAYVLHASTIYAALYLDRAAEGRDLGFLCDVVVDGEGVVIGVLGVVAVGLGLAAVLGLA